MGIGWDGKLKRVALGIGDASIRKFGRGAWAGHVDWYRLRNISIGG